MVHTGFDVLDEGVGVVPPCPPHTAWAHVPHLLVRTAVGFAVFEATGGG